MRIVGLTGGIGCGKSTVSAMWRDSGAGVVDVDSISRLVYEPGGGAYEAVVAAFGADAVLDERKRIDRKALGKIIFDDPAKKEVLYACVNRHVLISRFLS